MGEPARCIEIVFSQRCPSLALVVPLPPLASDSPISTLERLIVKMSSKKQRIPSDATNAIMYQLTRAIAHATGLGVCHLDVRPAKIVYRFPSLLVQLTGWDDEPTLEPLSCSMPYAAPELFLSPHLSVARHLKADVWSLGMILIELVRGQPLIRADSGTPLKSPVAVAQIIRALGTPCETALADLDPDFGAACLRRIVPPMSWKQILKSKPIRPPQPLVEILKGMLDWSPAMREPAASLLCSDFFGSSRNTSFKYSSATLQELTASELRGIVSHDKLLSRRISQPQPRGCRSLNSIVESCHEHSDSDQEHTPTPGAA